MDRLETTFDSIIATVQGNMPPVDSKDVPADDALVEFQDVLRRTILPRRITLRGNEGARVSVIAKNRRVVNLSEVHPASHWTGETNPETTECNTDFDGFAGPFVTALVKTMDGQSSQIEQSLLVDPLPATKAGYPAAMLSEHAEQALKPAPAGDVVAAFLDTNEGYARARFGSEIEITVPAQASVDHDWMQDRIDEALRELKGKKTDLQFLTLDGAKPMAIALVWLDGEGAIVLADDPDGFKELEENLYTLRPHL